MTLTIINWILFSIIVAITIITFIIANKRQLKKRKEQRGNKKYRHSK